MSFATEICKAFVARAEHQGMKGKARDRAALEFLCGASVAARELSGNEANASSIQMLVVMVSIRGYSEVKAMAGVKP